MDNIVNLYIVSHCSEQEQYFSELLIIYPYSQYYTTLQSQNTNYIENELKILYTGVKQLLKNNIENNYGYSNFYVKIYLNNINIKFNNGFDISKNQSNYLLINDINTMLSKFTKVDLFKINKNLVKIQFVNVIK